LTIGDWGLTIYGLGFDDCRIDGLTIEARLPARLRLQSTTGARPKVDPNRQSVNRQSTISNPKIVNRQSPIEND
jgi:hypothetical protein